MVVALMIKAGQKGSTINDVIWMGDVVNQACHLAAMGNTVNSNAYPIMLSRSIFNNLNSDNQKLCNWNAYYICYQSNAVNIAMNDWLANQK